MKKPVLLFLSSMFLFLSAIGVPDAFAVSAEKSPSAEIVSAHTSGIIPSDSTIKVRFVKNIARKNMVGKALAKSPVEFTPPVKGKAFWIKRNTLEFRPDKPLPAGTAFIAVVRLSEIVKKAKGKDFRFKFAATGRAFEIEIDGLRTESAKSKKKMAVTGKIHTMEKTAGSDIINILTAEQDGKGLNVRWTHAKNGKEHEFTVAGILRGENPSKVTLKWDGKPIGVDDQSGERVVNVPAFRPFEALQARAMEGETRHIEIRFSDPLQRDQDLDGLIRTDDGKTLRFTVDGSIVRVYATSRWESKLKATVNKGIRNALGQPLDEAKTFEISFLREKPAVRFVGKGVILPGSKDLTVPIETVNLRAVVVEAIRIYEETAAQFFQVNNLDGDNQLRRVGRTVWRKTIPLDYKPENRNTWVGYGLDVSRLVNENPGGLFRLRVYFKQNHTVYDCPGSSGETEPIEEIEETGSGIIEYEEEEVSFWDNWEEQGIDWYQYYEQRKNPCHPAYFLEYGDHDIRIERNVLVSNIGLIAKKGAGRKLFVVATDIRTASPISKAEIRILDYHRQEVGREWTDRSGMAVIELKGKPFLLEAKHANQFGYMRLDDGSAQPVSHFDVYGETVKKGLKGFIYGERGVWRPGDDIHMTFILFDREKTLPKDHPVLFELRNPRGQLAKTVRTKESVDGFYSFKTGTAADAPTGNWTARVKVGGAVFEKKLKIETVMPNRLKIGFDVGGKDKSLSGGKIESELSAMWLHGAIAKNLKADVNVSFAPGRTKFKGYEEYVFDDPVREYRTEKREIFKGKLNAKGKTKVRAEVRAKNLSPGILTANFTTRVFEPGGAFSIDRFGVPYHPYDRYAGIRVPKGDKARGMLLTDTAHPIRLALVDKNGKPAKKGKIEIAVYKIKWRWWWEKGSENLNYVGKGNYKAIAEDTVRIANGKGEWKFEIKYPEWGRYLIRAKDVDGKHYTGKIVYVDWPGWAGRAQKDSPGGASVLTFSADKESYKVGENIVLSIPTGKVGRCLVSLETGSRIIKAAWLEAPGETTSTCEFMATEEMSPNVYAHVTFLQPHMNSENDLPIRMYGLIPIKVENPATRLFPVVDTPETFIPEETAEISVREENGKPMTYTVAIVDEGLLDLTRFKTPEPRSHFYKREALGVKTWDMYDFVAGAYGGVFQKLLAIGGDGSIRPKGEKKAKRFPPMVRFIGPFKLEKNATAKHKIDIPQYVGSVRVMIVAGNSEGAFGSWEKAVFVRKPLMVLATLPRVLGPNEEVAMPVSVFALDEKVKNVSLKVDASGPLSVEGAVEKSLSFSDPGDDMIFFKLKAAPEIGMATVSVEAVGGDARAGQTIEIDIRMPGGPVVDVIGDVLQKRETWNRKAAFPGMEGTNEAVLEISRVPPLNLGKRLKYLIKYPHGCVEQTTSSVFPQLYLDKLLKLTPERSAEIQENVKAGIEQLQKFQNFRGGFAYWPGDSNPQDWATNYAGHFMLEAGNMGYVIPSEMKTQWIAYQRNSARAWERGGERSDLIQAYRLYTLALAGSPELGAMNRLREDHNLSTPARWRLAAAYELAGRPEAAAALVEDRDTSVSKYRELSNTYGSDLRDRAMILETLCLMNRMKQAKPVADIVARDLGNEQWHSTQTTAYALVAMANYTGLTGRSNTKFAWSWNGSEEKTVESAEPVVQIPLDAKTGTEGEIVLKNLGEGVLFQRVILAGIPLPGNEKAASNGMEVRVKYLTLKGKPLKISKLEQGTDFIAEVTTVNTGHSGPYKEVALSHIFPSGWEIHNTRMDASGDKAASKYNYQDIRDDRVYTYFDIEQGKSKAVTVLLNSAYLGKFWLPMVSAETMYDATINARTAGKWVEVVQSGE